MKNQPYVVLARKHRPRTFEEVLGQAAVCVTLRNALKAGHLAHAYLFTGPRGVGKTTMARLLARALNCAKGPSPEPCGDCHPCREIAASSSIDVLEMDAASHTGVDNIREVIIETVALQPCRDRYKVFIIDEAHMLSTAAFNALLKTLEEPPGHVVFILATTESAKIPATILSRCQRFRFKPIPPALIAEHLGALAKAEKIAAEPEALELLARQAGGSLRDAVSLLDQAHLFSDKKITTEMVREAFGLVGRETLEGVARALLGKDARALGDWLARIHEEGIEAAALLRDLREALHGAYLAKLGAGSSSAANAFPNAVEDARPPANDAASSTPQLVCGAFGESASAETLAFMLRRLGRTLEELRFSEAPRLTVELGLFGCLEAAGDLAEWVGRLEEIERRLAGGAPGESGTFESAPAAPSPGIAPAVGGPDPQRAWRGVLEALAEKPSLVVALRQARLQASSDNEWTLVFAREFDLQTAKRSLPAIEAVLAEKAGRPVALKLEVGAPKAGALSPGLSPGAPPPASGNDSAETGAPGESADLTGPDEAFEPESAPEAAPLNNAAKILGGTIKFIKKK